MDRFPPEIFKALGWYVYRLIDPRSGHTFYVGKGRGDRIFDHVRCVLKEDAAKDGVMDDLKTAMIKEIEREGMKVLYVIHRHGIETSETAYQIEAALIDAYPGLTNLMAGHASADKGCRTVEQIRDVYAAEELNAKEPLILIFIGRALDEGIGRVEGKGTDIYDAVRAVWKMKREKAESYKLVLAYDGRGLVVGAFRPEKWLQGTRENFPFLKESLPDRIGFEGQRATEVEAIYLGKKVPPRKKGAMTPFRYLPQSN